MAAAVGAAAAAWGAPTTAVSRNACLRRGRRARTPGSAEGGGGPAEEGGSGESPTAAAGSGRDRGRGRCGGCEPREPRDGDGALLALAQGRR